MDKKYSKNLTKIKSRNLPKDPYNIIITGVGGQGNVMASRILGEMLLPEFVVTTGDTFGASQRGGAVMSHLRISSTVWSPQIPKGKADLIVGLEPGEALRAAKDYGNSNTVVVTNTRPVYPVGVTTGRLEYPSLQHIKEALLKITDRVWFLNATDTALRDLQAPILGNTILLGAVAGLKLLPIDKKDFERAVSRHLKDRLEINVKAFQIGMKMVE